MQKTNAARWLISIEGVDMEEKIFVLEPEKAYSALSFQGARPRRAIVPTIAIPCIALAEDIRRFSFVRVIAVCLLLSVETKIHGDIIDIPARHPHTGIWNAKNKAGS
jgi:hypothetical protein